MSDPEKYQKLLELEKALSSLGRKLTGVSVERLSKNNALQKSALALTEELKINANLLFNEFRSKLESAYEAAISGKWDSLWKLIRNESKPEKERITNQLLKTAPLVHPFRSCPLGFHHVKEHPRVTEKGVTSVREHCRRNPTHHDHIYSDELKHIANEHFKKSPDVCPSNMGYKDGSTYDTIIQGWTDYWNEVQKTQPPLDPNIIKALIASESSFKARPKDQQTKNEGKARGIMQITDKTRKILGNEKGEFKDHFVHITEEEAYEPKVAIGAGVRWLHQKHKLASSKLKRTATWEETVAMYKGRLKEYLKATDKKKTKDMKRFLEEFEKIKNCRGKK
ncbi:MAG: transglycosylase SLT domain-containing protein [Xanthomonadaceae bacterium]|nr:transglycosylase SLT domain-containing protein [Xanthomonadaceae bacterium]